MVATTRPAGDAVKPIALAVLAIGIILLIYGLNASDSPISQASEVVTGTPAEFASLVRRKMHHQWKCCR